MKKILIVLVPLLAFGIGAAGGNLLHGANASPEAKAAHGGGAHSSTDAASGHQAEAEAGAEADAGHGATETAGAGSDHGGGGHGAGDSDLDWFRFPNQFFVPILRNGTSTAVIILSLGIEMPASARADIEAQEHRLRDALLSALMIEANTGAFDGNFTSEPAMRRLRSSLLAAGQQAAGPDVTRILIEDIGRQAQ